MKSPILTILCASALALTSCGEAERNTEAYQADQPQVGASTGTVGGGAQDTEAFRLQADSIGARITADLGLDEQASNRVRQVYLNHLIKLNALEEKYAPQVSSGNAELNNNVGVSNSAGTQSATGAPVGTVAPGMEEERQAIRQETQESLKGVLSAEQFAKYEANMAQYEPRAN